MLWIQDRTAQIRPALNSLRRTFSQHQQRIDIQQDLYQKKINWHVVGSVVSLIVFFALLFTTIVLMPVILTVLKKPPCSMSPDWNGLPTPRIASFANDTPIHSDPIRLCTENASWNPRAVTVAGLASGSPSTSLSGLRYPKDIYVYDNGTILIADYGNDRITKWNPNATEGVLIAGTGSYGSWDTLMARPWAIAIRNDQLYVSDLENYRIQVFPLNTNISSPAAVTLIGRYGQGSSTNQINQVTSLIVSGSFSAALYMVDSQNHRVLLWDPVNDITKVIAGESGTFGSDSMHLHNPLSITLNENTNSLYIADTYNNRIQKYELNTSYPAVTVGGWNQLNNSGAVQLDPSGINMFIADTFNHRILLWLQGALQGRIIAGNGTAGNSAIQLDNPAQIRFDSKHNLYVVDTSNNRIQRFDLISDGC